MKRLLYLMTAFILFSCENNEVVPDDGYGQAAQVLKTRSVAPEVYAEDGYLVVENFKALDSISDLLGQMTDMERVAWENKMKFESAYSYFKPYFDAFDALETLEEMENYQEQHKTIIKVINDDECCDVDYPFQTRGRSLILSKDGKIKVGNSLWIYKSDRKITIIGVTDDRIGNYCNAITSSDKDGIFVDYYDAPKTRLGQSNGFQSLKSGNESASKRRYYWSLDLYPEQSENGTRMILALYQQGKKKKIGGYNVYKTTYSCCIDELRLNNVPKYTNMTQRLITSKEERGGQYFGIVRSYYPSNSFPNFYIILSHSSRGCSPSGPLTHTYSNAFPPDALNSEIIAIYSGS